MRIDYIAFDSLGVKSSCVAIKTNDVRIVIDPGIAMETNSFPLPLSEKLILDRRYKKAIAMACKKADIIVITHYHYDHHIPKADLYKGKRLLIKDPIRNINKSQRERAAYFLNLVKKIKREIEIADGKRFKFGKTEIKFSKALWHGVEKTPLGKVIMVKVKEGNESVLYSSDIDGPYIPDYVELMAKENPSVLILDGHPTYLLGFLASFSLLKKVLQNTIALLRKTNCRYYILDHHLLRDYRYRELYYEVYREAKRLGKQVLTAAEALGKEPKVIEGYHRYGPTRWRNWEPLSFNRLDQIIAHAKARAAPSK